MVRDMMTFSTLPIYLWGYELQTSIYILNRVPYKSIDKTLYELCFGRKPSLEHLRTWGCPAYVKKLMTTKLESKSKKLYFVGYPKETRGYYFYHDQDQTIVVWRNAKFLENEYILSDLDKDEV